MCLLLPISLREMANEMTPFSCAHTQTHEYAADNRKLKSRNVLLFWFSASSDFFFFFVCLLANANAPKRIGRFYNLLVSYFVGIGTLCWFNLSTVATAVNRIHRYDLLKWHWPSFPLSCNWKPKSNRRKPLIRISLRFISHQATHSMKERTQCNHITSIDLNLSLKKLFSHSRAESSVRT